MSQVPNINGRLSDALVNSGWCVSLKQNNAQSSSQSTPVIGEQARFSSPSFDTVDFRPCLKNKSCTNGYDLVNY